MDTEKENKVCVCGTADGDFTEKELKDAIAQTIFNCIDEEEIHSNKFRCSFIEGEIATSFNCGEGPAYNKIEDIGKYILHVGGHVFGDREYEIILRKI